MKAAAAWIALNALLVSAQIVGALTSWAYGTLLLLYAPEAAQEWSSWATVGAAAVGTAIAFLFWVVGYARKERIHG